MESVRKRSLAHTTNRKQLHHRDGDKIFVTLNFQSFEMPRMSQRQQ